MIARSYKNAGIPWCIIGDENYGEGSSREHAALEPRYLGCAVIVANSFARIHETNLKKQGVLALTFADKSAYEEIRLGDKVSIIGTDSLQAGKPLSMRIQEKGGNIRETLLYHSYSEGQISWLKEGSALNSVKRMRAK